MENLEQYINYYYADNAKELRKLVDGVLRTFGDVPDKDNFYSIANEVFVNVLKSYDGKGHFQQYLKNCITNKIKTEFTRLNRDKRMQYERNKNGEKLTDENGNYIRISTISLDADLKEEDDNYTYSIVDLIQDNINIEDNSVAEDSRAQKYLNSLSKRQREMAELFLEGYKPAEIREKLNLTEKEYRDSYNLMSSYDKKRLLCDEENDSQTYTLKEEENMQDIGTSEKTKNTSYSVESLSDKEHSHVLLDNHPNQRGNGQWSSFTKSAFVSDILQGKSIPAIVISEERVESNRVRNWIIDGKQRCTTLDDYLNDGFAVSSTIPRFIIDYSIVEKDKDGNYVLDEQGFPMNKTEKFDIRRKKFSQLPEELQKKFKEYQVPVTLNLNCTKEEIVYDIARYNRGRGMNKAQVGWTEMDEDYAILIDTLLSMDFFSKDCAVSNYQKANNRTGALRRVIVEAFMTAYHVDIFSGNVGNMCKYITNNVKNSEMLRFLQAIEELTGICTPETAELFNIKDSFLWFALFARFKDLGLDSNVFIEFLNEFVNSLCNAKIDGVSFSELNNGGTKDRSVVTKKITFLDDLMKSYLCNRGLLENVVDNVA